MKLNFDIKNKKADLEADVEKLVEKGMDLQDKNWKDKFDTKYNARKEILELKHKQKMESEEIKRKKRNWFERMQDEKRKQKELELQEQKIKEAEIKVRIRNKAILSTILGMIAIVIFSIGSILGSMSGNPDSGFYAMSVGGIFVGLAIPFMWISEKERMERKTEEKRKNKIYKK